MKASAQHLKAIAAYKLLKARARVISAGVGASEIKLSALAKAAVLMSASSGDVFEVAAKCSVLLANAVLGQVFTTNDVLDIMATLDAYEIEFSKVSADEADTIDQTTTTLYKVLVDTVTTSDAVAKGFSTARFDSADSYDIATPTRAPMGGVLAPDEIRTATDFVATSTYKALLEQLTVTDDFDGTTTTSDDQVLAFTKFKNDLLQTSEIFANAVTKPLPVETLATEDAGYVFWTNYCDASYFSEGYVGQQTNFT